jgi:nucleoside 2-deoxyribosyltransferase
MRLDQQPKAGLIDNHLRVEIQKSRFLVADLTYNNNGAYWEGGYAEGLGKPIFYSYEKSFFRGKPSHFDANHSYTVLWDFENLAQAAAELKDAIRATLPDEAKMTDD